MRPRSIGRWCGRVTIATSRTQEPASAGPGMTVRRERRSDTTPLRQTTAGRGRQGLGTDSESSERKPETILRVHVNTAPARTSRVSEVELEELSSELKQIPKRE